MQAHLLQELEYLRRRVQELEKQVSANNRSTIANRLLLSAEQDLYHQFQLLVAASPLPIVVLTREGKITLWNPAAERLFGWTAEEVVGGPLPFIPDEKRAEHLLMRSRDLSGDALKDVEIRRVRKDGTFVDLRVSTALLHDADGAVTGIVSLYADITSQKKAAQDSEAARQRMERQWILFDTALSHTPDSIYIFDRECRIVYANQTLLQLWQKSFEEVRGKNLYELGYAHDLVEKVLQQIHEVIQTGKPLRDEVRISYRVQTSRQNEYILAPIFNAVGEVEAVAGSTRDITERHESRAALEQANKQLEEARRQLADIFENMADSFYALDNDWRFTYVNRRAEAVLSRTKEELLGRNLWEELTPAAHSLFYDSYHRAKEQQIPVEFEAYDSPMKAWFEVRAYPSSEGIGVYFHDITGRKDAQEALKQQTEELARINADLEHFAYAAAHDMQEPLRMVSLFTQLLKRKYGDKLDQQASQYISYAADGAKRMEMLVHDLLAYTRSTVTGEETKTLVAVEDVLKETLSTLATTISHSKAAVTCDPLPSVVVHKVHLQQLFLNLIGNALKYRSQQPPCIHIQVVEQQNSWLFQIKDNGIGIDEYYREHIFGLFKRLHNKDEYEGTGIGLAICQKIVQRYGGNIWVESQLGQGSTFFFTLPRDNR